ncbi:MAG: helix-turn-helix domain-containing protein [Lachnospiraceae bacterium]|nr:helix-turn-helix domain-containing protein [Lachnospiraceae bacterium]
MDTYGTILRKRIKEMGYTQQEFADKVPMPLATLKKYMSDRGIYSIDYLKRFGELLDCSYDYLMGVTVSPRRDIQDIKDETRLSDEAIDKIKRIVAKIDDTDAAKRKGAQTMIACLDLLIKTEVYETMATYLGSDDILKPIENYMQDIMRDIIGEEKLPVKVDNIYALAVLQELDKCKREMKRENQ